jgi:hypothetical protein
MNTRPLRSNDRPARKTAPRKHADARLAPRSRVRRADAASPAAHDEILNPLWLIAIAMVVFFGAAAALLAAS